MKVRLFEESDFAEIQSWWSQHQLLTPTREFLPETGAVVEVNGKAILAFWLYKTDSRIALLETMISKPDTASEVRDQAAHLAISFLKDHALGLGFKLVWTASQTQKMTKRFEDAGFRSGVSARQLFWLEGLCPG